MKEENEIMGADDFSLSTFSCRKIKREGNGFDIKVDVECRKKFECGSYNVGGGKVIDFFSRLSRPTAE